MVEDFESQRDRRFKTGDAERASLELLHFLAARVRSVVRSVVRSAMAQLLKRDWRWSGLERRRKKYFRLK